MISNNDDPLARFGEFTEVRNNRNCRDFPQILDQVLLTPYRSGYITLKGEQAQQRNRRDNFSKSLKDILADSADETKEFAFADFIMHPSYVEDQVGRISFPDIMSRLREFYKVVETGFDKYAAGLDSKNHHLLEYQFFSNGYVLPRPDNQKEYHLLLFSAVERKETIEFKLLRSPKLFANPGQVLTMLAQLAETLRTIIFETSLFGDDQNPTLKPVLPRLPGLLLGDVWIFGKWYFKMNWAFGLFDPKEYHFLSNKIRERINQDLKNGKSPSKEEFYNYNLSSLAQIARLYLRPNLQTSVSSQKDDLNSLKEFIARTWMDAFKEEGELLFSILETLLLQKSKGIFRINDFIAANKEYQNRDPIKNLLMEVFEEQSLNAKVRLTAIQKAIINKNVPRGLELKVLHELIRRPNMKRPIGVFTSVLNDTEVPPSAQTLSQPLPPRTGPLPPFLDVGYPLDQKDICNIISPGAVSERISCQVHPLFDRDFFVYRASTNVLMMSIEFCDDLTLLLSELSKSVPYLNAELDQERRVVLRSALNTQAFENELESHITALDTLSLIITLVVRKLNFCIENEEFGRIGSNRRLILDEVQFHLERYQLRKFHLTHEVQF